MAQKNKPPDAPVFKTQAISYHTNTETGEARTPDENVKRAKQWVDENEK